jgi:hypothetical protein
MSPAGVAGFMLLLSAMPAPAAAQAWSTIAGPAAGPYVSRQVDRIRDDIRAGRRAGQLTKRDARALQGKADAIAVQAAVQGPDGASEPARAFQERNAAALHDEVVVRRSQGRR